MGTELNPIVKNPSPGFWTLYARNPGVGCSGIGDFPRVPIFGAENCFPSIYDNCSGSIYDCCYPSMEDMAKDQVAANKVTAKGIGWNFLAAFSAGAQQTAYNIGSNPYFLLNLGSGLLGGGASIFSGVSNMLTGNSGKGIS